MSMGTIILKMTMKSETGFFHRVGLILYAVLSTMVISALATTSLFAVELDEKRSDLQTIIKVTPTLVYIDDGDFSLDEEVMVLRRGTGDRFVRIGEVRVIRVFQDFVIAEITITEPDEKIQVLNKAISVRGWETMARAVKTNSRHMVTSSIRENQNIDTRSIQVFAGLGLGKESKLVWRDNWLSDAKSITDRSIGLRLAKTITDRWRVNLAYRLAGEPVESDSDITQLSIEVDSHYLLRDWRGSEPYVGFGAGFHQLTWDVRSELENSTTKIGFQGVAGLEFSTSASRSYFVECGYQRVVKWGNIIDASNFRLAAGVGRKF